LGPYSQKVKFLEILAQTLSRNGKNKASSASECVNGKTRGTQRAVKALQDAGRIRKRNANAEGQPATRLGETDYSSEKTQQGENWRWRKVGIEPTKGTQSGKTRGKP